MAPGSGPPGNSADSKASTAIDGSMPIETARYVVIDTELTGLKVRKDSIVSIGAVVMRGGRIEMGNAFYRVVEPRTPLTGSSIVIHEITPSDVEKRPAIDQVLPEFLEFCAGSVVVGHFVSIDLAFLNEELKQMKGARFPNPAVDTFKVYQWSRKKEENACSYFSGRADDGSLRSLAERFGIKVSGAHNALQDAFMTAQLFQRLLSALPRYGVRSLADLLRIGNP
jgi:DNA polymerase-3 subunit epsilon